MWCVISPSWFATFVKMTVNPFPYKIDQTKLIIVLYSGLYDKEISSLTKADEGIEKFKT